jgi:hypothetical protein
MVLENELLADHTLVFFSAENITAENVSLYAVFRRIFQR